MKIAFFSNFLNHHQLPLCLSFLNSPQVDVFKFVACEEISHDRIKMGYKDMNKEYPFVVCAYENDAEAIEIAENYDVVIFGATNLKYVDLRMKKNLLSFRFSERPLKKGTWRRFIPRTAKKIYDGYTKYKNQNMYVLCASSYTASDLTLCGFDERKCFKWGYFPQIEGKDLENLFALKKENRVPEILYAGRLLKFKRVEDTVKAVNNLVKKGVDVHFTIIGEGECQEQIRQYIDNNALNNNITMLPFMSPQKVREYMDKADIYVLGSNFYEGWGAVINESMNSGCAVVVSHSVGSAKYLIENGINGYIYKMADVNALADILYQLIADPQKREEIGRNAYETVGNKWSSSVAVDRFLELCSTIRQGEDYGKLYKDGPCSMA